MDIFLPPYIKANNPSIWQERYQTVFASEPGAVAAPTAGLIFDEDILPKVDKRNLDHCSITLHDGLGTFNPIKTDSIYDHTMHYEKKPLTAKPHLH